jgi:hypothetical protein
MQIKYFKRNPIAIDPYAPYEYKYKIFDRVLGLTEHLMQFPQTFGRDDLKKHLKLYYNFPITHTAATEGMFCARGELLEKSNYFSHKKMVDWMARRVPDLVETYKMNQNKFA